VLLLGSAGGGTKEASEIVSRNGLHRRGCSILGVEEVATFLAQECGGEWLEKRKRRSEGEREKNQFTMAGFSSPFRSFMFCVTFCFLFFDLSNSCPS
jgi:hypothetical protein